MSSHLKILLAAGGLATMLAGTPAFANQFPGFEITVEIAKSDTKAGPRNADKSVAKIRIADLDLTQMQGGVTLLKRTEAAAKKLCQPRSWITANIHRVAAACRDTVVQQVVSRVNAETLTAAYTGRTGKPIDVAAR
jgi:UrcA family protein